MSGGWLLRPAGPADAALVAGHRYFDGRATAQDCDRYAAWLGPAMAQQTYVGIIAMAQDAPVAGAGLNFLDWGPVRGDAATLRARVVNVYVEPAWRRQGLARAMLAQLLAQARSRGVRTVSLAATDEARSLYAAFGFQPSREEMLLRLDA